MTNTEMTSRERVLRAMNHQDLDRVPCRFGAEDDLQICRNSHEEGPASEPTYNLNG